MWLSSSSLCGQKRANIMFVAGNQQKNNRMHTSRRIKKRTPVDFQLGLTPQRTFFEVKKTVGAARKKENTKR